MLQLFAYINSSKQRSRKIHTFEAMKIDVCGHSDSEQRENHTSGNSNGSESVSLVRS